MSWYSFFAHKKYRLAISAGLLFALVLNIVLYFKIIQLEAVTHNFTQSDWTGGADTVNTANSNSGTWTKYYSASTGITAVSGTGLKLKVEQSP